MTSPVAMTEIWRGGMLECTHLGHAVICDGAGEVMEAWGDPEAVIFPRSACKMIQALPLMESGAADRLSEAQVALSCASHRAAKIHTDLVTQWLSELGLGETDLRCGPQEPGDIAARDSLIRAGERPCQIHNNCSGKHTGFLMLNKHLGGGPDYEKPDHVVQKTVKAAFEEVTGETSPGFGIDGCSAPNFATSLHGLARAMAYFARATDSGDARQRSAHRLARAMANHPELVAGEGTACTELMRATGRGIAIKTGAEGVYTAIIPHLKRGIALKITDGGTRGSEAAIAALLVHLGVLDADHPATLRRVNAVQRSRRGIETGILKSAPGFP